MVNYMFKVDSSKQGLEGGDIIHNRVFAGLVHILNVSVVVRSPRTHKPAKLSRVPLNPLTSKFLSDSKLCVVPLLYLPEWGINRSPEYIPNSGAAGFSLLDMFSGNLF